MSDQQESEILLEMTLHKAIDKQMDLIVQLAVRVACLLEGGAMRESQLRNVLNTALSTQSLELVANFIRYQIGRSSDWQRKNFGEEVIAMLSQGGPIDHSAMAATAAVLAIPGIKRNETEVHSRAHVVLVRRFLGELNRAFLYADRTRSWKELQPILFASTSVSTTLTAEERGR